MTQKKRPDDDLAQRDVFGDDGPELIEGHAKDSTGYGRRSRDIGALVAEYVHDADELSGIEGGAGRLRGFSEVRNRFHLARQNNHEVGTSLSFTEEDHACWNAFF